MTTSAPKPEGRLLTLAGHYSFPYLFGIVASLAVATSATGNHVQPLRWTTTGMLFFWIFVQTLAGDHHEQQLCERCAAKMPLDGEAQAGRRRRILRWHHQSLLQLAIIGVVVASVLLPWGDGGDHEPSPEPEPDPAVKL